MLKTISEDIYKQSIIYQDMDNCDFDSDEEYTDSAFIHLNSLISEDRNNSDEE